MRVVTRTAIGLVEDHNEDQWLADEQRRVFVVADGLGGRAAGAVASNVAVQTLDDALSSDRLEQSGDPADVLGEALRAAQEAVRESGYGNPNRSGMGTTAVIAYLSADERVLWLGHVGDSRAYLCRADRLHQLTSDHRRRKGGLSQALGVEADGVSPDTARIDLEPDDRLLLCSDGLTDLVDDDTIAKALRTDEPIEQRADALVNEAMNRGGHDNVTLVVIDVEA